MIKSVSAASGVGFIAAFLPGFGSSQAAIVATNIVGDVGEILIKVTDGAQFEINLADEFKVFPST